MSVSVLRYDEQAESQRTRIADYVELTKPRISVMVMVTVAWTELHEARQNTKQRVIPNIVFIEFLYCLNVGVTECLFNGHCNSLCEPLKMSASKSALNCILNAGF